MPAACFAPDDGKSPERDEHGRRRRWNGRKLNARSSPLLCRDERGVWKIGTFGQGTGFIVLWLEFPFCSLRGRYTIACIVTCRYVPRI